MASMDDIERLAAEYAAARRGLADVVAEFEADLAEARNAWMPTLRARIAAAAVAKATLEDAVEGSRPLFEKPKTRVFADIRVGWVKGKGSISWDDPKRVLARIKAQLPGLAARLIKTVETPNKRAIAELAAADLKRIGVSVAEAGDAVLVAPVDSAVEKTAAALLDSPAPAAGGLRRAAPSEAPTGA